MRRERGFGVNPWRTHSRFLVSHHLLADAAYADPLREWLGPFMPGSLLILDEAHHAAPSSGGRYGIETKFTRGVKVRKKALDEVMIRRLKEDIRRVQGGFPVRKVVRIEIADLPDDAPELVLSRLLDEYRTVRDQRLQDAGRRAQTAAGLLTVGLQQRLLSSVEAFARSLARLTPSPLSIFDGEGAGAHKGWLAFSVAMFWSALAAVRSGRQMKPYPTTSLPLTEHWIPAEHNLRALVSLGVDIIRASTDPLLDLLAERFSPPRWHIGSRTLQNTKGHVPW